MVDSEADQYLLVTQKLAVADVDILTGSNRSSTSQGR